MAQISSRSNRLERGQTHWQVLERGRREGGKGASNRARDRLQAPERGGAGSWYVRALIDGEHKVAALGAADDLPMPTAPVLDWKQAQAEAREWAGRQTSTSPLTVETAIAGLRRRTCAPAKASVPRAKPRAACASTCPPMLGARQLADLTTADLTEWRNGLVDLDGDEDEIRRSRDTRQSPAGHGQGRASTMPSTPAWWRRSRLAPGEAIPGVGEARKVILSESRASAPDRCLRPRPARAGRRSAPSPAPASAN